MRLLLESHNVTVAGEAASGEEALEMFDEVNPNVVIADIAMGEGMDGIELTRRIKQDHPEVRVLVVSMHDDSYYIESALNAGADGYVIKHNTDGALEEAIEALLNGERYLCIDARKKVKA